MGLLHLLKQALGNKKAVNVVQPQPPHVYLKLRFKDPEDTVRDFPAGIEVNVRFGTGVNVKNYATLTAADGKLSFSAADVGPWANDLNDLMKDDSPWRTLTLTWDTHSPPHSQFIVCEPRGDPVAATAKAEQAGLKQLEAQSKRYFSLPQKWELKEADLVSAPKFVGNGSWDGSNGAIKHTAKAKDLKDIGTVLAPVELVLNLHWKFLRFQYFDRYFGPPAWAASPVATSLGKRVTIPPVSVEGFREKPRAVDPVADTHSNWTIGGDVKKLSQCLPWIAQRPAAGKAAKTLTGADIGLRFKTEAGSYVFSNSDTDRKIFKTAPPGSPPGAFKPGADRLKYYHLPEVWKSYGYFTHPGGKPAGTFFPKLSKKKILAAESTAKALVFCLDDLVLTDENLRQIEIHPKERVALFHHRFANRKPASPTPAAAETADLSNEGVYKPGADVFNAAGVDKEAFPYGTLVPADPLGRANHTVYYIQDYPDWTRLVIAVGNIFDAFDERVPDDGVNEVVGARAAVRWVNLTQWQPVTTVIDRQSGVTVRPAPVSKDYFHVQPLYFQDHLSRNYGPTGPAKHLEWVAPYTYPVVNEAAGHYIFRNGRADIAHVRCCDHDGNDEIAVLIRYHRFSVVFDPVVCTTQGKKKDFARDLVLNVNARWNSPVPNHNEDCTWILPRTPSPPSPPNPAARLRTKVVTFTQFVPKVRAHFDVTTLAATGRSGMAFQDGTGDMRVNAVVPDEPTATTGRGLASAHETGHAHGLPDDYLDPDTAGDDHPFYYFNHVPGSPYVDDALALMKSNHRIRARILWHNAEWLHNLPALGGAELRVKHGAEDFQLPHYPHAASPGRHFVSWPVSFNIYQRNAATDTSLFDSYLYAMGADVHSTAALPLKLPLVGGLRPRVDGILLAMVRIKLTDNSGTLDATNREKMYKNLLDFVEAQLNYRRTAAFQLMSAASPPQPAPSFKRCLLHFRACLLTASEADAGARETGARPHLLVTIDAGAVPVAFADNAPPNQKALVLPAPAGAWLAWLAIVNPALVSAYMKTLGLDLHPPSPPFSPPRDYTQTQPYVRIVRTVMSDAAPDPIIS